LWWWRVAGEQRQRQGQWQRDDASV
jgi:hypothetical protein